MRATRFVPAVLGLALVAGACGDSTGAGNTVELSEVEAEELFTAIETVIGGLSFGSFQAAPILPALSFSSAALDPINESESCPEGGTVSLDGDVNGDENSGSFNLTLGFANCGSEGHTIDGDLEYDGSGDENSIEFSINGTLTVELPTGRSGDCVFDIEASFTVNGGSIDGSICGRNVSDSQSF